MNKVKLISIGFLVLGIGCISWALINIIEQRVYSADFYSSPYFSSNAYVGKQFMPIRNDAVTTEPFTSTNIPDPDKSSYPVYPGEGDNIGILSIPVLKQKLPIIEGTTADDLKKGVGHFIQSVLPGEDDNCVLSGHRDTVFAKLDKLKIADQLIVQTSTGTFTYEIIHIRIVDKDDKTVIVHTDHAVLTLSTCYPFQYIGSAPDRYIIVADLVISKYN